MAQTWLHENVFHRKDYFLAVPVVAVIASLFYSIAQEDPATLPSSLTIGLFLWATFLAPAVFYSPLSLFLYPSFIIGGLFLGPLLRDLENEPPSSLPPLFFALCWLTITVYVRIISTWQKKRKIKAYLVR